jgi:Na+/H+ antiporter NhaC
MIVLMDIIRSLIFGAFVYFVLQFWAERFNQVHKEEEDEYLKKEQRKELLIFRVLSILAFGFLGWFWLIG